MSKNPKRTRIELNHTGRDILLKMAEGNPGGLDVLMRLLKEEHGLISVLSLDDMNIWGSQIWIGYKDYCGSDLDKFAECIKQRDQGMIDKINEFGKMGNHSEIAVEGGASRR